jgi:hypothetical protein
MANPKNLALTHCVPHATVQIRTDAAATPKLGSDLAMDRPKSKLSAYGRGGRLAAKVTLAEPAGLAWEPGFVQPIRKISTARRLTNRTICTGYTRQVRCTAQNQSESCCNHTPGRHCTSLFRRKRCC